MTKDILESHLKDFGFDVLRTYIDEFGNEVIDEWICHDRPCKDMCVIIYTDGTIFDMFITTEEEFRNCRDNYYEDLKCVLLCSDYIESLKFMNNEIYGWDYSGISFRPRFVVGSPIEENDQQGQLFSNEELYKFNEEDDNTIVFKPMKKH